jgi:hypothetical protein
VCGVGQQTIGDVDRCAHAVFGEPPRFGEPRHRRDEACAVRR